MALDLSLLDAAVHAPALRGLPPVKPPTAFEEDPAQPRNEFGEDAAFSALVRDVALRGVLQPLVVRRMPNGMLRIRFGARRYRAALRAGLAEIPYVVTEDERHFDDYAQVAENSHRQPLQPLELGQFVLRKMAAGESRRAIARKLDMHPSAITHLLALAARPPSLLLELYHSRRCRSPYYLYLLRKLMRRDAALVEQAVAAAAYVDLATIEAMTAQVLEKTVEVPVACAGSAVAGDSAPALAAAPRRRSRAASRVSGIELLGMHAGRPMVLLMVLPDMRGHCWVRYSDTKERSQVALSGIVLTEVKDSGDD